MDNLVFVELMKKLYDGFDMNRTMKHVKELADIEFKQTFKSHRSIGASRSENKTYVYLRTSPLS